MKKIVKASPVLLLLCACALFTPGVPPYPSGLIFPLVKDSEILTEGSIISPVEKEGDLLFFSTEKGFVYGVDGKNQKILWNVQVSDSLSSPPFLGENGLYVYEEGSRLYCLSKTGEIVWEKTIEEKPATRITEINNRIYFGTEEGKLVALDSATGETSWSFRAQDAIRAGPVQTPYGICFGSNDGNLYFVNDKGSLVHRIKVNAQILSSILSDGDALYFATEDRILYCFDQRSRKIRWQVRTGGPIYSPPVTKGNRLFFLCWNSVLYCLNKKNGTVLWWQPIPSRSAFPLDFAEESLVATSQSPFLVSYDVRTGSKKGEYDAKQEIQSNPVWLAPYLMVSLYDSESEKGVLQFLKKQVKVELSSSKTSPQKINEEIVFTAAATGFFNPSLEFYLLDDDKKEVVQERSEKKTWSWFPAKAGSYKVGVEIFDEREKAGTEIAFVIEAGEEKEKDKPEKEVKS